MEPAFLAKRKKPRRGLGGLGPPFAPGGGYSFLQDSHGDSGFSLFPEDQAGTTAPAIPALPPEPAAAPPSAGSRIGGGLLGLLHGLDSSGPAGALAAGIEGAMDPDSVMGWRQRQRQRDYAGRLDSGEFTEGEAYLEGDASGRSERQAERLAARRDEAARRQMEEAARFWQRLAEQTGQPAIMGEFAARHPAEAAKNLGRLFGPDGERQMPLNTEGLRLKEPQDQNILDSFVRSGDWKSAAAFLRSRGQTPWFMVPGGTGGYGPPSPPPSGGGFD